MTNGEWPTPVGGPTQSIEENVSNRHPSFAIRSLGFRHSFVIEISSFVVYLTGGPRPPVNSARPLNGGDLHGLVALFFGFSFALFGAFTGSSSSGVPGVSLTRGSFVALNWAVSFASNSRRTVA